MLPIKSACFKISSSHSGCAIIFAVGCWNFSFINFTNLKKLYVAGGEPTAMPEFYMFLDKCIGLKQTDFEFVINTNATNNNS